MCRVGMPTFKSTILLNLIPISVQVYNEISAGYSLNVVVYMDHVRLTGFLTG